MRGLAANVDGLTSNPKGLATFKEAFTAAVKLRFPSAEDVSFNIQVRLVNRSRIQPPSSAATPHRRRLESITPSQVDDVQAIVEYWGSLAPLKELWDEAGRKVDDAEQKVGEAFGAVGSLTATLANEVVSWFSSPVPESCLRLTPVKDASGTPIGPGSDTPIKRAACKDIDLCIMLDSSGSIEMPSEGGFVGGWAVEKELAVGIIKSLGSVRNLLVVRFDEAAVPVTTNAGNISQAILDIRAATYTSGDTNITAALRACSTALDGLPAGGTTPIGPIVVLITDGQDENTAVSEAFNIKSHKSQSYASAPKIFTLGMGEKAQVGLLRAISSGTGRAFLASDGSAATLLVNSLTKTACDPATLDLMQPTHFGMTEAEMAQFGSVEGSTTAPAATAARWASTHYVLALMSTLVYRVPLTDLNGTFTTPYTGGNKIFDILHDIGLQQWAHVEVADPRLKKLGLPDAQVFIASSGADIIVALRGSQEVSDWVTDFTVLPCPWPLDVDVSVHLGFLSYASVVNGKVGKILASLATGSNQRVWFTGHSLGGAATQLLAALFAGDKDLPLKMEIAGVITFEAPLPGEWPRPPLIWIVLHVTSSCGCISTTLKLVQLDGAAPPLSQAHSRSNCFCESRKYGKPSVRILQQQLSHTLSASSAIPALQVLPHLPRSTTTKHMVCMPNRYGLCTTLTPCLAYHRATRQQAMWQASHATHQSPVPQPTSLS